MMLIRTALQALSIGALALSALLPAPPAFAQGEQQKLVNDAQKTLDNFMRDPDQTWIHDNIGRA
jgi:hypothetical protein